MSVLLLQVARILQFVKHNGFVVVALTNRFPHLEAKKIVHFGATWLRTIATGAGQLRWLTELRICKGWKRRTMNLKVPKAEACLIARRFGWNTNSSPWASISTPQRFILILLEENNVTKQYCFWQRKKHITSLFSTHASAHLRTWILSVSANVKFTFHCWNKKTWNTK